MINKYWTVNVKKMTVAAVLMLSAAQASAGLIPIETNGGFEGVKVNRWAAFRNGVMGWQSTAGGVEIQRSGRISGVTSYQGNQHAEVNTHRPGALYRDIKNIAEGRLLGFSFAHRARLRQGENLQFSLKDLGVDGVLGGGDDTTLFSQEYSASKGFWTVNAGLASARTLGNTVRISFDSLTRGSASNLIDAVELNQVPITNSFALLGLGLFGMGAFRKTRASKQAK